MISITEKQFENKVKKYLKNLTKCWFTKIWGGGYQKAGIPDILACINGKFVAIELKSDVGKPSELQKRNVRLINESNGYAVVLYPKEFEDFKKLISEFY